MRMKGGKKQINGLIHYSIQLGFQFLASYSTTGQRKGGILKALLITESGEDRCDTAIEAIDEMAS